MASNFLSGLSGGNAVNNMNIVQLFLGRKLCRYTVVKTTSYSARTLVSRVSMVDAILTQPFTLKNS